MICKCHNPNSKRRKEVIVIPTEGIKVEQEEMVAKEREKKRLEQILK